jgi:MFS transporter, PPP family, 3-phenylpropionic acid transporter
MRFPHGRIIRINRNVTVTIFPRFVLLYAAMYAAYGVASPFLPAFVSSRGIAPEALGLVLGTGTAVRLVSAPIAGRIGDLLEALRMVLVICIALAAFATLGYLPAEHFSAFLAVAVLQAAALAPMGVLADALALGASKRERFEYGWVRGTGSAAFIAGTLISGQAVAAMGLGVIVVLQAMLLGVAALTALAVPELPHPRAAHTERESVMTLARLPVFRNLVVVAALVLGSHAMLDAFAMIRWRAAGVSSGVASLLWSEAVLAEVVVFFLIGPALVRRLTPPGALALAAAAGIVRWVAMALSAEVSVLALVQPLHGITFALLHLACMRLIAEHVPVALAGTAQAVYGTVGIGGATALLTFASGALYGRFGAGGFWAMAVLCALALPVTWRVKRVIALH